MIMSKNKALLRKKRLPAFICAMSVWLPAQAQQVETGTIVLEEIIVTAQKRTQSIQDIGFSVAAFDEDDAQRFASDIGALAGQVPGVESYGNNSYLQTFFIRGIGLNEFSGNFNPPIGNHRDEVYISKNWAIARPTFDIERIEVLKGPQGTLFGRNTNGGAVNFYSKEATQESDGYIRASADEHSRFSLEGALGGALSESLSGRLSVYRGFGNGGPQFNLFDGEEHGEPDVSEVRGQLIWELDNTRIKLLAYGGSDDSELTGYKSPGIFSDVFGGEVPTNAAAFCPEILSGAASLSPSSCTRFLGVTLDPNIEREPEDIFTINQNNAPRRDDSFSGGYFRVDHDFSEKIKFTSITAYDEYDRLNQEDSDGTPIASNDATFANDLESFSQEFRLTGSTAGDKLQYVAGLYYSDEDLDQLDFLNLSETPFNLLGAGLPPALSGQFSQNVESIAAYFNGDYSVNDKLTLTFGARYTDEETTIDASTAANLVDGTSIVTVSALQDSRDDSDTSFRFGASYNVNDSSLAYLNIATGFRSGGYSVPFGGTIIEFEPEEITSYELGYKTDITPRLRLNAALFTYQYDDLQVNVDDPLSPVVPITRNIDESESTGVELDVTWIAADNLTLKLGYSYLDAEFTETDRVLTTISTLGSIALEGNAPVNSPENQFNGSLQYTGRLSTNWAWNGYLDFRWVDDRALEVTNQPADVVDSYTVANASVSLTSLDERWDVRLWVKNLNDEEYITYINNLPGPGFALNIFGEQRTAGISVGYRF
jgi:iron complex outermembrane receptor protein